RSRIGTIHSHLTGSPPKVKPDRSGASGPGSDPGESSSSTAPETSSPPSGNVDGSSYQRMLCPGPNQVTARHGYVASHRNTRAACALGGVVGIASSILAYLLGSSSTCSTTGIRWQLMPTVDKTVYGRCGSAGRSVSPVCGGWRADVSR